MRRRTAEALVIVNGRASAIADPPNLLAEVQAGVRAAGARAEGVVTYDEDELRAAVEQADGRRVVLVGGDGTLHTTLNLPIELPELALVPAGRANNVARALGIPQDHRAAARMAVDRPAVAVDTLLVRAGGRSTFTLEALSAGLQADARSRYHGENSGDLGAGAYALAQAMRAYQPFTVELELDGQAAFSGRAGQVFLANMPFFGFGFRVDPFANPSDGLLEAIVLEAPSRVSAAALLLSVYRGHHLDRAGVHVERAHHARLTGPLPIAADGEPLGVGSVAVSVERGRLRMAASAPATELPWPA
ncbi:MAG TPA: diacylglycerol kinase family protein [Thermoleophilaceae bacterium]|nr:diacylglycerol kinase family protein [Thermoleophilaceae bacterium]